MILEHKNFLFAMANCGIMTKHIAKNFYNIHHKTLNYLLKNNVILLKGNLLLFGKISSIYILSEQSKNKIRVYGKFLYKTNTSQLEHDYLLLKFYSTLPIQIRNTWLNETELKEIFGNGSTTDGMFFMNNNKIGLEVLTPNYTNYMIKEKLEFADKNCDKIIKMNTADIKIK